MLTKPTSIYINWAAYDELSDTVELTEKLAMQQLDELLRLRDCGVQFDAYVMDCFWFAPEGGLRTWRKPHWPDGPDRWLDRCADEGVLPGLWFPVNCNVHPIPERRLHAVPEWTDSLVGSDSGWWGMCLFHGGYLAHYLETLKFWYERGVRVFKFDFANFAFAPKNLEAIMLPSEIFTANLTAFQSALRGFKRDHPDSVTLAYNGFNEGSIMGDTFTPLRKAVDVRWLECFDALYCGDPRAADVPAMNFWRAKDIYSDHMTRYYEFNNIPLSRIDNSAFMIGLTGTCYHRGAAAWKGMLVLSLARGGLVNTYYGNLELLDAEMGRWFARAQKIFYQLHATGTFSTFGEMPGAGRPYGFVASAKDGGLITVVNPSQEVLAVALPMVGAGRVLFRDAGFVPTLKNGAITLGPEQMALIGLGTYADARFDLGLQEDVVIPNSTRHLPIKFKAEGEKTISASIPAPASTALRIVVRQENSQSQPKRTSAGQGPAGKQMGGVFKIEASQNDKAVPITINYDMVIWSGLSWAVGEIAANLIQADAPLTIRFTTLEKEDVRLTGELYEIAY